MKFRLIIDKTQEEEVVVTLHSRTALADEIEALVTGHSRPNCVPAYLEDDVKLLSFEDIECITVLNGKTFAIDRKNQHYRLRMRLYELEKILPASFIRINKNSITTNETEEHNPSTPSVRFVAFVTPTITKTERGTNHKPASQTP